MSASSLASSEAAALVVTLREFDAVYSNDHDNDDDSAASATTAASTPLKQFDFVQWTDSFNMEQIEESKMHDWLQQTVERILRHTTSAPNQTQGPAQKDPGLHFFEIGCGTGLVLFQLLCSPAFVSRVDSSYTAIELSSSCVANLEHRIKQFASSSMKDLDRIRIRCAAAHEDWFDTQSSSSRRVFDSILINSVAIYFPSERYLAAVVSRAFSHCRSDGGCIFIGDNRDARTLTAFYAAIALHRDSTINLEDANEIKKTIDEPAKRDPHLLLAPIDIIRIVHSAATTAAISTDDFSILLEPKYSSHSLRLPSSSSSSASASTSEEEQRAPIIVDSEMVRYRFDCTIVRRSGQTEKSIVATIPLPNEHDPEADDPLQHVSVYPWKQEIERATQTCNTLSGAASQHGACVGRYVQSLLAPAASSSSSAEVIQFIYPHAHVMHDVLTLQQAMDRQAWKTRGVHGAKDAFSSSVLSSLSDCPPSISIVAARILFSPRELEEWFRNQTVLAQTWNLTITLHPTDATMLLCLLTPKDRQLTIKYVTAASKSSTAVDAAVNIPVHKRPINLEHDVFHQLVCNIWRRFNSTHAREEEESRDKLAVASTPTIPALFWSSMHQVISDNRGAEIAVHQFISAPLSIDTAASAPVEVVSLDWISLAQKVAWISHHLRDNLGLKSGQRVLQCCDRAIEQVVGMVGVLCAELMFTPLSAYPNPDPIPRLAAIMKDAQPALILTQPHLVQHIQAAIEFYQKESSDKPVVKVVCMVDLESEFASSSFRTMDVASLVSSEQSRLQSLSDPSAVAYSIYTSGSTGTPKAAQLTHSNFIHLLRAFHSRAVNLGPQLVENEDRPIFRMLQTTAPSFDLSVYEILAPLLTPALALTTSQQSSPLLPLCSLTLLRPGGHQDLDFYVSTILHSRSTHIVCTPSMMTLVAEHCTRHGLWTALRFVRVWRMGGEALHQALVDVVLPLLRSVQPQVQLICSYGPAECTDTATISFAEVSAFTPRSMVIHDTSRQTYELASTPPRIVSIGTPLPSYAALVLVEESSTDSDSSSTPTLRVARTGEAGMLYLAGAGTFQGYLQSHLNQQVLHRASPACRLALPKGCSIQHQQLYRTGDRAVLLCDAAPSSSEGGVYRLHFLGRADFSQIKLHGQRIETGEIEHALLADSRIQSAIVMKRFASPDQNESSAFIASYVILRVGEIIPTTSESQRSLSASIRSAVASRLPSIMVPASVTVMSAFPLNRNGKADRSMLGEPDRKIDFHTEVDAISTGIGELVVSSPSSVVAPVGSFSDVDAKMIWLRTELWRLLHSVLSPVVLVEGHVVSRLHPTIAVSLDGKTSAASSFSNGTSAMQLHVGWLELGASSLHLMRFLSLVRRFVTTHRANASARVTAEIAKLQFPCLYRAKCIHTLAVGLHSAVRRPEDPEEAEVEIPKVDEVKSPPSMSTIEADQSPTQTSSSVADSMSASSPAIFPDSGADAGAGADAVAVVKEAESTAAVAPSEPSSSSPPQAAAEPAAPVAFPFRSLPAPSWSSPELTKQSCPQQIILILDDVSRHWEKPTTIYNSPFTIRVRPSTSNGTEAAPSMTVQSARATIRHLETIMHSIVASHASLRVGFSFDATTFSLLQHVWSLESDLPRYSQAARIAEIIVRQSELPQTLEQEMTCVEPDGRIIHDALPPDAVGRAIRQCAHQPLMRSKEGDVPLFRFQAIMQLPGDDNKSDARTEVDPSTPVLSLFLLLNFHHSIFDGESIKVVMQEIARHCASPSLSLLTTTTPSNSSPFFDYCSYISSPAFAMENAASLGYWIGHLHDWDPASHVRTQPFLSANGLAPEIEFTAEGQKLRSFISHERLARLITFGKKRHMTSYTIILMAFLVVQYCTKLDNYQEPSFTSHPLWSGFWNPLKDESDLVIGSAMANREQKMPVHDVCGLLANCVPFRQRIRAYELNLDDFLEQVSETVLTHLTHQAIPYGALIGLIDATQGPSKRDGIRSPCLNPFFSSALLYEDHEFTRTLRAQPIGESSTPQQDDRPRFDLELLELPDFGCIFELQLKISERINEGIATSSSSSSSPVTTSFVLTWEWAIQLFRADSIAVLDRRFHAILDELLSSSPNANSPAVSIHKIAESICQRHPMKR